MQFHAFDEILLVVVLVVTILGTQELYDKIVLHIQVLLSNGYSCVSYVLIYELEEKR